MKKSKLVVTNKRRIESCGRRLKRCRAIVTTLETGENLRRGCGHRGLMECASGWKCFYCGNIIYKSGVDLDELWFHFRIGREYWRIKTLLGKDFINGVPVSGRGDSIPAKLLPDLAESRPPKWFPYFLASSDEKFQQYLQTI